MIGGDEVMKVVEIKNGYKVYGKGETEVVALKNANLTIDEGEFIAILGSSGSGKSTLLNMIGALDNLTNGELYICETNCNKRNDEDMSKIRRSEIGFIFQAYNLIPVLTVYENIVTPIILDGKSVDEDYIDELLKLLKIEDKKHRFPNQLSGGQQQRVAIARALGNKPKIILADEPTGNLDAENGEEVLKLLCDGVKKYNNTLILVTHNEKIAEKASRVIYIRNGEIHEDK